jgi:hypothetical protein
MIIIIILTLTLSIERIFKHVKKSKCCGNSEVEFDQEASAPNFPNMPFKK